MVNQRLSGGAGEAKTGGSDLARRRLGEQAIVYRKNTSPGGEWQEQGRRETSVVA